MKRNHSSGPDDIKNDNLEKKNAPIKLNNKNRGKIKISEITIS